MIGKFGAPTYTVTFFNPNLSPFRSIGCPFAGFGTWTCSYQEREYRKNVSFLFYHY